PESAPLLIDPKPFVLPKGARHGRDEREGQGRHRQSRREGKRSNGYCRRQGKERRSESRREDQAGRGKDQGCKQVNPTAIVRREHRLGGQPCTVARPPSSPTFTTRQPTDSLASPPRRRRDRSGAEGAASESDTDRIAWFRECPRE